MISPQYLANSFARTIYLIKRQTDGMSEDEALIQLPFRGNCMNWVVGHIAVNRNNVLKLLGAEPVFAPDLAAHYATESEPITGPGDGVVPLAELIATLDRSQERLSGLLNEIGDPELQRQVNVAPGRSMTVGERLLFFYFHETYHAGQTEILRQAAGKDDKVI